MLANKKIPKASANSFVTLSLPMEGRSVVSKFDEAMKTDNDCKSPKDFGNSEIEFPCIDLCKKLFRNNNLREKNKSVRLRFNIMSGKVRNWLNEKSLKKEMKMKKKKKKKKKPNHTCL